MPAVGDVVAGKYRIERALSSGGMGSVYVATHLSTHREFAIKVMSALLSGDEEAEARFFREAKLATAIDHAAIIQVYDVGRDGDFPFMVMELLRGESLGERLKRGPMPPAQAVDVLLRVIDGVAAAHARGVVHRDLKPDNIFLCVSPDNKGVEPKVLDFGISKLMTKEAQTRVLTQTGIALGTPLYMSAEQVRGAAEVDHRTDVYALGVILYELLTGTVPFNGNTYPDLVFKIITGDAPLMHVVDPSLSPELSRVVHRALALERDDRYQSVTELGAALEALGFARAETIPRVSSVSPPGTPTPFATERRQEEPVSMPPRARGAMWVSLGAAAVALIGLALWVAGSGGAGTSDAADRPAAAAPAPYQPPSSALAPAALPTGVPDAGSAAQLPVGKQAPLALPSSKAPAHPHHDGTPAHAPAAAHQPHAAPPAITVTPAAARPHPSAADTRPPRESMRLRDSELIDPFSR